MRLRRTQLIWNAAAFCLLLLISVYRQIGLNLLHSRILCTFPVFLCYLILIIGWVTAILGRVTQKNLLHCLLPEACLMAVGLTGRFLQDTFFYENIRLMRSTGLAITATLLPILLLGVYAAMGMGQTETYRIPRVYLLLWGPVVLMSGLLLLDDRFHFIFRIVEGEEQPNLYYHPGIGFWIMGLMLAGLIFLRMFIIFRRNHMMRDRLGIRLLITLAEPLIISLFLVPYIISAMYHTREIIEVFAMLYYVEALTWELYIAFGLVPANIAWREVFSGSTLTMQILPSDGSAGISAANADPVPLSVQEMLEKQHLVELPDGTELHTYRIPDAEVIYRKDTHLLKDTLKALDQTAELLQQETGLLAWELQEGNKQVSLKEREEIYRNLRQAVSVQLEQMGRMIDEAGSLKDMARTLDILCILGTYVKRKSNLLLLKEESGSFRPEEMRLSLTDLLHICRNAGIDTSIEAADSGISPEQLSGRILFAVFETVEKLLELHQFRVRSMKIRQEGSSVLLSVMPEEQYSFRQVCNAAEEIAAAADCTVHLTERTDCYDVHFVT